MARKRKYPHYPWWLYDYQSDPLVQAMTDDQDLAYRRMIDASWDLGELPNDPDKISSLIRFSRKKFASVWKYPLIECWQDNGIGLINHRVEREWEKIDARYGQLKKASAKGVAARTGQANDDHMVTKRSPYDDHMVGESDSESEKIGDSKKDLSSSKNDLSLKKGGSGAPSRSARPKMKKVTGRVRWNKEEQKLDASDAFKQEFLVCWKREFTVSEIKEEMVKATRWLVPRPGRRGGRSRLDIFLHTWMENALADREAREEDEARMTRRTLPEPSQKWCPECRETLPYHADQCSIYKKQLEGREEADDESDDQKGR